MNVIIAGAGEVGAHAAEVLSSDGHSVTVIDLSLDRLQALGETLDLRTLVGHCAHLSVLKDAGVESCDLLLAATQVDEINMLTAAIAKAAGAKKTIVRVHHTANFSLRNSSYKQKLGIDELICPEYLTSQAIARTLRNPGSFALEEFGRGEIVMQRFAVSKDSSACGRELCELKLPLSTRVATVERESGASLADAHTLLEEGDLVTLIGKAKSFEPARKLFTKERTIVCCVWVCCFHDVSPCKCVLRCLRLYNRRSSYFFQPSRFSEAGISRIFGDVVECVIVDERGFR